MFCVFEPIFCLPDLPVKNTKSSVSFYALQDISDYQTNLFLDFDLLNLEFIFFFLCFNLLNLCFNFRVFEFKKRRLKTDVFLLRFEHDFAGWKYVFAGAFEQQFYFDKRFFAFRLLFIGGNVVILQTHFRI